MRVPKHLDGEAKSYWQRHAKHLTDTGILTDADQDTFELVCHLWADVLRLRELAKSNPDKNRNYLDAVKAWQSMARQFHLLPADRAKANVTRPGDVDEFGVPQ